MTEEELTELSLELERLERENERIRQEQVAVRVAIERVLEKLKK